MNANVSTFIGAEMELRKIRNNASQETKRISKTLKEAKENAITHMLNAEQSIVRVNENTWVVLVQKQGAFPKLSIETITDTLKGIPHQPQDGTDDTVVDVRDHVRTSLQRRGDGTSSLTVKFHPPAGYNEDTEEDESCVYAATEYANALASRNTLLDRVRCERAPAMLRRSEHEAAAIQYVAPNGGEIDTPMYRHTESSEYGKQYIKVEFKRRRRNVSRSMFMQLVDNELRKRLQCEPNAAIVASDSWLAAFKENVESTLTSFTEAGGIPDITVHVSVSDTPPPGHEP